MAIPAALIAMIPELVRKGADLFSQKFPTEIEKKRAEFEFSQTVTDKLQQGWEAEQRNLTERHANDMRSDSWLSKNIRPLALVYLMLLFTLAFFTDVSETVLEMLRDLLMTVFVFYFGARTIEKMTNVAAPRMFKNN